MLRREWYSLSYWFSREGLLSPFMLNALLWTNLLGTIYGYYWYAEQLKYTWANHPAWMTLLVPDSPTASLFFTVAIWWLYKQPKHETSSPGLLAFRSFVEAFAVVTSVKYGIWAVAVIFAAAAQGDALTWQDWMLTGSHLAMAVEGLLYAGFFRFRFAALFAVGLWTFYNDIADYGFGIFPWLPDELHDDLDRIQLYTTLLSAFSLAAAWAANRLRRKSPV